MLRKGRLKKAISEQIFEIKQYNCYGKRDMLARNMIALKLISFAGLAITLLIFVLSQLGFDNWIFMWHYWVLIPMYAGFLVFSFAYGKRQEKSYKVVRTAGILFTVALVTLLAGINVFYYPNKPDELFVFVIVAPQRKKPNTACTRLLEGGGFEPA